MRKGFLALIISVPCISTIAVGAICLAVFSQNKKPVVYHTVSFDTVGGSPISDIQIKHGSKLRKPTDPTKRGYQLNKWLCNDNEWFFDEYQVLNDVTLESTWSPVIYSIDYKFNGGSKRPEDEYISSYTIESEFEFKRPIKTSNVFAGWFDTNGKRFDRIEKGTVGNLTLSAKWMDNLVVKSLDPTSGDIVVYGDETFDNVITVENKPVSNQYHLFVGWYDENDNLLSTESPFTLQIDTSVVTTICAKYMSNSEKQTWENSHGVNPVISSTNPKEISYGMFPQSVVSDTSIIEQLNAIQKPSFDDYYYLNHEYYSKIEKARIARDQETGQILPIRQFDNGQEIIEGSTYWFKVEPIKWRVAKQAYSNYLLMSNRLIEVKRYHSSSEIRVVDEQTIYPNNYEYGDIRQWLNGDFYRNAFAFNNSNILLSSVNNQASTTVSDDNPYACDDTLDYVYLFSIKDYTNAEYGFDESTSSTIKRHFITTDYTRARGAYYGVESGNLFSGYCWTRSPFDEEGGFLASRNNMNGTLNEDYVGQSSSCVQPIINITL